MLFQLPLRVPGPNGSAKQDTQAVLQESLEGLLGMSAVALPTGHRDDAQQQPGPSAEQGRLIVYWSSVLDRYLIPPAGGKQQQSGPASQSLFTIRDSSSPQELCVVLGDQVVRGSSNAQALLEKSGATQGKRTSAAAAGVHALVGDFEVRVGEFAVERRARCVVLDVRYLPLPATSAAAQSAVQAFVRDVLHTSPSIAAPIEPGLAPANDAHQPADAVEDAALAYVHLFLHR